MSEPLDQDFRAIGFTGEARAYPRGDVALTMFAAFNGITPDQMPTSAWGYFPNEATKRAWERVEAAARTAIAKEREG